MTMKPLHSISQLLLLQRSLLLYGVRKAYASQCLLLGVE